MAICAARSAWAIQHPEPAFDAVFSYLPWARQFLADPTAWLHNMDMLKVAPGTPLYMAAFAADEPAIRAANGVLFVLGVPLLAVATQRLGGRPAGLVAAGLYTASPTLPAVALALGVEAPLTFLVLVWLGASAAALQPATRAPVRQAAWAVLAGVALAAATLTRATFLPWIAAAVAVLAMLAWRLRQPGARRAAAALWLTHAVALAGVGGWMARNHAVFDFRGVGTGGGAALYFGSNAVLGGVEPPYFGLTHDEITVSKGLGHLSVAGDRALQTAAWDVLRAMPMATMVSLYTYKVGANLFFSKLHLHKPGFNARSWRIALLLLAAWGLWAARRQPLAWFIAASLAYQFAVHVPLLYNPRYNISALDPGLMLLAGTGAAALLARGVRWRTRGLLLGAIAGGVLAGAWHHRYGERPMPDLSRGDYRVVQRLGDALIRWRGVDASPLHGPARVGPDGMVEMAWEQPVLLYGITMVRMAFDGERPACQWAELDFEPPGVPRGVRRYVLRDVSPGRDLVLGTGAVFHQGLRGAFAIRLQCAPGAILRLRELALIEASPGITQAIRQAPGAPIPPPP